VTVSILQGRARVAKETSGWGRLGVVLGLNEFQSGIVCVNDLSSRHKPKTENKTPALLADIEAITKPQKSGRTAFAHHPALHQHDGKVRTSCPPDQWVH